MSSAAEQRGRPARRAREGRARGLPGGAPAGPIALLLLLLASGCATYVDHLTLANHAAAVGDYEGAIADTSALMGVANADELPAQWSGDQPLAALERGSLQQAVERFTGSARDLSGAEAQLELLDMRTDPVGALGAYLYSDSVKTYRTPPTERLSLNAVNLLNYLAEGNLDGAAVEARRFQVMREYLDSLQIDAAGPATFGAYLAGFVFEQRGEGDRALRYYEEALARGPLPSLQGPVRRLAPVFPYRGPHLEALLAAGADSPSPARSGGGRLPASARGNGGQILVVVSAGRVPHRQPARIPVGAAVSLAGTWISGDVDWLKYGVSKVVVYPELVDTPSVLGAPAVTVDGAAAPLDELSDLGAAIRAEYEEAKPKIVAAALTRMAARAGVAEGVRAAGRQESEALGDVLSILVESTLVAFDRPDTRSWTMLPARISVARVAVAAGQHEVEVAFAGGVQRRLSVEVPPGGFAAVVVTEPR